MAVASGEGVRGTTLRETRSLCPICVRVVDARIEQRRGTVWISKVCPRHGAFSYPISGDVEYTREAMAPSADDFSWRGARAVDVGCPGDCGPCRAHLTAAGALIVELTNACNLPCATCIAGSDAEGRAYVSVEDVKSSIEGAIALQGQVPLLMLSGGEPTIHPLFTEILAATTSYPEVGHVMIISNGKRISEEPEFAERLAGQFPGVEVYLQFDSFDPRVLLALRGMDLSGMRRSALERLAEAEVPTSLVVLTNKRINLHEAGAVLDMAKGRPNVRGVTFQPIRATGRHDAFDYEKDGTSLTDVRSAILAQTRYFGEGGLDPHPLSPESVAVGYLDRLSGRVVTDEVNSRIKSSSVPPLFWVESDGAADLFRVAIVCFYDRFNFCMEGVRSAIVQFALRDGRVIPLDTYYLFYESPTYLPPRAIGLPLAK